MRHRPLAEIVTRTVCILGVLARPVAAADSLPGKIDRLGAIAAALPAAGAVAAAADAACLECRVGVIPLGTETAESLADGDCSLEDGSLFDIWLVIAEESTPLRISLHSSAFDTFLMFADSNCLVLDFDDDCTDGDASESCLELTVPPGEYFVVANSLSAGEAGDYRLRVVDTSRVGPLFRRADANSSGRSDISDAIFVLTFLFLGGPAPECLKAADMDDNGIINITDPSFFLNSLFLGGPPVPAPSTDCGVDPTEDSIECTAHSVCA